MRLGAAVFQRPVRDQAAFQQALVSSRSIIGGLYLELAQARPQTHSTPPTPAELFEDIVRIELQGQNGTTTFFLTRGAIKVLSLLENVPSLTIQDVHHFLGMGNSEGWINSLISFNWIIPIWDSKNPYNLHAIQINESGRKLIEQSKPAIMAAAKV